MDYTELAKLLLGTLIRKDNYKNIIEATSQLSDSALLCEYLQENGSATIKEIIDSTNIQYEKVFEVLHILIDKEIVSYSGYLSLNENSKISLTSKGAEELVRINAQAVAFVSRQLKKLSTEEAEQFVEYSLKIINTDSKK
ncbi:MAG: MoaD/ThiS family protein [Eubacterium sp.]|nr:MoaD/ThiS family protein [Eubacterium sp.]